MRSLNDEVFQENNHFGKSKSVLIFYLALGKYYYHVLVSDFRCSSLLIK